MMFKNANQLVLTVLGVLLLAAAVMKGWQLLVEPVANKDIWSNRLFLIFMVECELALGIWLISGLFRKAAWLAAVVCFGLFSAVTLYKGISGAESCGCFGSVHVNPWITLFAIDIPSILTLSIFRQKHISKTQAELNSVPCHCENHACQECKCKNTGYLASLANRCKNFYKKYAAPLPSLSRLVTVICVSLIILVSSACVLALNEPAKSTSKYEILEPETWIGKALPIVTSIDVGTLFTTGNWAILLYHHTCPKCSAIIYEYEPKVKKIIEGSFCNGVAFIEVPPLDKKTHVFDNAITTGRLIAVKDWIITTPCLILLSNGIVTNIWEVEIPNVNILYNKRLFEGHERG